MEYIINPYTKRKIKVNGPTYKKLLRKGAITGDEARVEKTSKTTSVKAAPTKLKKFKVLKKIKTMDAKKEDTTFAEPDEDDAWDFNDSDCSDDDEPQTPLPKSHKKEEVVKIQEKPAAQEEPSNKQSQAIEEKLSKMSAEELALVKKLLLEQ